MTEASRIIEDCIPAEWSRGLVELCGVQPHTHGVRSEAGWVQEACPTPGKRPVGAAFNSKAAERWRAGADPLACLRAAQAILDKGGNLGMVPPPGVVVLDADTPDTVDLLMELCPAGTPVMQRTASSAHFYLRVSPDLPLKGKRIEWQEDDRRYAVDLRLPAKNQAVVPPSRHKSGTHYAWLTPLPDDPADVPHMPAEIEELLRTFHREQRADARRDNDELPGHDRLRHFVNRWCRIVDTPAEVRAHAVRFADVVYRNRDERKAQCIAPGGELDRLIETGWQMFGGRNPLREDKTDQGYVDLFLASHDYYLYNATDRHWAQGEDGLWDRVPDEFVRRAIGNMNLTLFDDAARDAGNPERRDRLASMAKHLRMNSKVTQVYGRLKDAMSTPNGVFDSNPDELMFPRDDFGRRVVLNTETLVERWATAADRFTREMGAPYDTWTPEAMRFWLDFVKATLGDDDTVSLVQRALGLSLKGRFKPHKLYFLFGRGGTGKSTLLKALMRAFGTYAVKASFATFAGNGRAEGNAHSGDVARMRGARLVVCSEIPDRGRLGAQMKDLTGDDRILARNLYGNAFEFDPTHSVWVAGNVAPDADFLDDGVERRLMVIPADNKPAEVDHQLGRKLASRAVLSAVIAWAIEGLEAAVEREREGLDPLGSAAVVDEAAAEYWRELNPVEEWFRDHVTRGPGEFPAAELYKAFLAWIEQARGLHAGRQGVPDVRHFSRALKRLGLGSRKGTKGMRLITGVKGFTGDGRTPGPNNRAVLPN